MRRHRRRRGRFRRVTMRQGARGDLSDDGVQDGQRREMRFSVQVGQREPVIHFIDMLNQHSTIPEIVKRKRPGSFFCFQFVIVETI